MTQLSWAADSITVLKAKIDDLKSCDLNAIRATRGMCDENAPNKAYAKCMVKHDLDSANLACSAQLKKIYETQAYFHREKAKPSTSDKQYKELTTKSEEIFLEQYKRYDQMLTAIENSYQEIVQGQAALAASQAQAEEAYKFERRLNAIRGGLADISKGLNMLQPTTPQVQQYQINGGRVVTCNTLNNFTSCN